MANCCLQWHRAVRVPAENPKQTERPTHRSAPRAWLLRPLGTSGSVRAAAAPGSKRKMRGGDAVTENAGRAAAPPAVLHTLAGAGDHEERSPPRRGLILTGPHPAPPRSVRQLVENCSPRPKGQRSKRDLTFN